MAKKKTRIVICDRSQLATNIYEMILKPHGVTLFTFSSLSEFRKAWDSAIRVDTLVVNENALDKKGKDLNWLEEEPKLKKVRRYFLCSEKDSKLKSVFRGNKQNRTIDLPFYPEVFGKAIL